MFDDCCTLFVVSFVFIVVVCRLLLFVMCGSSMCIARCSLFVAC